MRIIIGFPSRIIAMFLGIPNYKIVYKSGHIEYYYLSLISWKIDDGKLVNVAYETPTNKQKVYLNIDAIESIVQIY